ncbi:hypothetical protein GJAV_G00205280 [Gymnothorax javanicus]|nr:hypothetical protein GJAV_G00205280 [Gymnothorax javanicus]
MAPALTETATDGHGIHLSSPLGSSSIELDGSLLGMELDPQVKLIEDDCSQMTWLNLTFLPSPDACSKDALENPALLLSPLVHSSGSCRAMLQSSPGTLLNLLSLDKSVDSPKLPCSQAPDAYIPSLMEHEAQDAARPVWDTSPKCPPPKEPCFRGAESMALSPPLSPPWVRGEREMGCPQTLAHPGSSPQQGLVPGRLQRCRSRQRALRGRVARVQRRLQAVLGEHATRHCGLQLGGLKGALSRGCALPQSSCPLEPRSHTETRPIDALVGLEIPQEGGDCDALTLSPPQQKDPSPLHKAADVRTFLHCAQSVISELRTELDSDATESSSDEDCDIGGAHGSLQLPVHRGREWKWWAGRAEISSRWTWLQVRVSELEFQIQQLNELRQQIGSTKGGVVLAETFTGRGQQTLLTEERGVWDSRDFTSDPETEPSSPTRLLWNIEKQSAQLSRIVNSLMPPYGLSPSSSPSSKPPRRWKGRSKRSLSSDLHFQADLLSGPVELKRRRVCRGKRKLSLLDSTCVAARTRPLLTYHKPRLFILDPPTCLHKPVSPLADPSCDLTATHAHSSCSSLSSTRGRCIAVEYLRPHPVISLTSETPPPFLLQSALYRDDWFQRLGPTKTEDSSPCSCLGFRDIEPDSPALLGCGHTEVHHGKRSRRRYWEGLPARWSRVTRGRRRRAWQGGRKIRRRRWTEEESSYCLPPTPEDSPPDLLTPSATQSHKHTSQSSTRQRLHSDCFFDFDDIVIPMSFAVSSKVAQLKYKNILTPSWRIVNVLPAEEKEGGVHEEEVLSDEAFTLRHEVGKRQERLRWSSSARGRNRQSCRSSTSNGAADHGSLRRPVTRADWGSVLPATDTEDSFQEYAVPLPWERRTFPLTAEDEEALLTDGSALAPLRSGSEEIDSCSADSCSERSLSYADCCTAAPSAGGKRKSRLLANMEI